MAISDGKGNILAVGQTFGVSLRAKWQEISQLVPSTVDTTNLRNPSALLAAGFRSHPSNSRVILVDPGTSLILRVKYPANLATITNPIVSVFGVDDDLAFHKLTNAAGATTSTLTLNTSTDDTDGTWDYSQVVQSSIFDLQGSKYFIVVISTALNGTVGDPTTSRIQYKIV